MTATFADTNVFLYAASNAPDDQSKKKIAREALSRSEIALSAQVMQEFYVAAVTKQRLQMSHDEAVTVLQSLAAFPVCPISREMVLRAIDLKERHHISYWDAAILAAAQQLGCGVVLSEDLNHGQEYDGVRVINPFLPTPAPPT
jgi:predicted nucleic acid-binding protein